MLAIALALAAATCWGTGDFLGGLSTRRATLWAVVAGSQVVGLGGAAIIVVASGRPWPGLWALLPVFLGGAAGAVAIASFYKALAIGTMSIVAPITATSALVPFVVGIARGERPEALQVAGIALAAVGVVLAATERGRVVGVVDGPAPGCDVDVEEHESGRPVDRRSMALALVAALGIGVMLLGYDASAQHDAIWAMLGGRMASVACFAALLVVLRPALRAGRSVWPGIVGVGVFDTGANGLFALATTAGYLSIVSVIGSLYPVITVVLAYALLHERIAAHQKVGVVAALAGVALIAGG